MRRGFAQPAILDTGSGSIRANDSSNRLSFVTMRFAGISSRTLPSSRILEHDFSYSSPDWPRKARQKANHANPEGKQ
jgi:hypothetical protein